METRVALIQQPGIDFNTFVSISYQALGYSPSEPSDSCQIPLSDTQRYLSCLAALKDRNAPVDMNPRLQSHASFTVSILADERDIMEMLDLWSGMPFLIAETVERGIQLAFVTGTLAQWHDAVKHGCSRGVSRHVRSYYNQIYYLFVNERLNVWRDCEVTSVLDGTICLEARRRR